MAGIQRKPKEFFVKHVKTLFLAAKVSKADAHRILAVCTGVTSLTSFHRITDVPKRLDLCQPTHLAVKVGSFGASGDDSGLLHPLLARVSHLEITKEFGTWPEDWLELGQFPRLTHLALHRWENEDAERVSGAILHHCPGIKVVVLLCMLPQVLGYKTNTTNSMDPRVVKTDYPVDWAAHWRDSGSKMGQMWQRAEKRVEQQRKTRRKV